MTEYLCRDNVWQRQKGFMSRQGVAKTKGPFVARKQFVSLQSLVEAKEFYVATKYFMLR